MENKPNCLTIYAIERIGRLTGSSGPDVTMTNTLKQLVNELSSDFKCKGYKNVMSGKPSLGNLYMVAKLPFHQGRIADWAFDQYYHTSTGEISTRKAHVEVKEYLCHERLVMGNHRDHVLHLKSEADVISFKQYYRLQDGNNVISLDLHEEDSAYVKYSHMLSKGISKDCAEVMDFWVMLDYHERPVVFFSSKVEDPDTGVKTFTVTKHTLQYSHAKHRVIEKKEVLFNERVSSCFDAPVVFQEMYNETMDKLYGYRTFCQTGDEVPVEELTNTKYSIGDFINGDQYPLVVVAKNDALTNGTKEDARAVNKVQNCVSSYYCGNIINVLPDGAKAQSCVSLRMASLLIKEGLAKEVSE